MKWPQHTFGFWIPVGGQTDPGCPGSLSSIGCIWGRRHSSLWGTLPLPGFTGPELEGKEDRWLPGMRGRGWKSPKFPPLKTCLDTPSWPQVKNPSPVLITIHIPVGRGGAWPPHHMFTEKPCGRSPFGICVAASWVSKSKGWGGGDGALWAGVWEDSWLSQRPQAGGMSGRSQLASCQW